MNRWIGEKDDFCRARCSTQDFALLMSQDVFSLQGVVLADSLHRSSEYLAKSQPNTSPCRTRWPLGHRSEEICAFSTISFDKTSARPLHQVLALPPDDITRRLKKPAFYLSTTITIWVEMTPLITQESHCDYQHTSIDSLTTTIRQQTPDFVLQQSRKKLWLSISQDVYVPRYRRACENSFRMRSVSIIENDHVSPLEKEPVSCLGRIEKAMSEREKLERGRRRFELFGYCSWYKTFVAVQEIIVWLANGIMLQIVLCL